MEKQNKKIRVLFGTLEYIKGVGGVGSVTVNLPPALVRKGFGVDVVTPFFDAYLDDLKYQHAEKINTITHIYKGKPFKSDIFRVSAGVVDGQPIYHYLIKPIKNSPVARLFEVKEQDQIYRSWHFSEAHNRREYYNSAVAAMIRMSDHTLPEYDIYHAHAWHAGLAHVIMEEMEHAPKWQALQRELKRPLKKNPYKISTVHMLLAAEHGQLTSKKTIADLLESLGLPADLSKKFSAWKQYINPGHLKQVVLTLLYSDHVTTVSEGMANEAAHITGGGQGLDELFNWLDQQQRFEGVLNGIPHTKFDATTQINLKEFAFNPHTISADKQRLKEHLQTLYPQLDPKKMWFGFVGRFAAEKGMDMLRTALEEITKQGGIFIIMGKHIITPKNIDGKLVHEYQALVDELRKHPNVLVIDDPAEQARVGAYIRAATDVTTMLSHNEACGLPQIEGFANAAFAVAPAIQGLPDSVKDLDAHPDHGTGFLYSDVQHKRHANLKTAIAKATKFYHDRHADGTIDSFLYRIWENSKKFDWNENPAKRYTNLYNKVLKRLRLTYDRIRTVYKPMLSMLSVYGQKVTPKRTYSNQPGKDLATDKVYSGKIFQIGPNKCGTTTIYLGFVGSNISSIHYGKKDRTLASIIYDNYKHGRPLLNGIDEYDAYFDMEDIYHPGRPLYVAVELFKELDKQYPGSKFILNTRDKNHWLRSRFLHKDPMNGKSYADELCTRYNCTAEDLYLRWSKEWDDHHQAVRAHFADRPTALLEYNFETDTPQKICDFFEYLNLDVTKFAHANKTMHKDSPDTHPRSRPVPA